MNTLYKQVRKTQILAIFNTQDGRSDDHYLQNVFYADNGEAYVFWIKNF